MIIAVASGKGGTGKSLVSANMACSLAPEKEVVLVDCDVEEPNLHLFFPSDAESEQVSAIYPVFDEDVCTHCGICGEFCQYGAITVATDNVVFFPALCHSCGGCTLVCPVEGAVRETPSPVGRVDTSLPLPGLTLISGVLNEGEIRSGDVIAAAKEKASGSPLVIIDAPPGASCTLVDTLTGCDACILVTEPTPFGLHDLEVAAGVAEGLGIPAGVVINRSLGDSGKVEEWCRKKGLPVLLTIPFDRGIARTVNRGGLIARELPGWKEAFSKLYEDLLKHVEVKA